MYIKSVFTLKNKTEYVQRVKTVYTVRCELHVNANMH